MHSVSEDTERGRNHLVTKGKVMITISQLTEFLGWASIINIGYLLLATIILIFMKGTMFPIHKKMFDVDEKELNSKYFDFLSNYKIVTLVFMVAPYIALKIMGQ